MVFREDTGDGTNRVFGPTPKTGWLAVSSGLPGFGYYNNWVDFDARTVAFCRDGDIVRSRGFMKNGSMGSAAFYLPTNFLPDKRITSSGGDYWVPTSSNNAFGAFVIDCTNGAVIPQVGSNAWFSFDMISWKAAGT